MTLQEVITKFFKEERTKYFHPSDRQGECYLRYHFEGGGVTIEMGTTDEGEITVFVTKDAVKLDTFLNLLIHG
jgi:hypothetical protein